MTLEDAPALLPGAPGDDHTPEAAEPLRETGRAPRDLRKITPPPLAWGDTPPPLALRNLTGESGFERGDNLEVDALGECLGSKDSARSGSSVFSCESSLGVGQPGAADDRVAEGPCWFWLHKSGWRKYGDSVQKQIDEAYTDGYTKVRVKIGKEKKARALPMEIFFYDMIQWDPMTDRCREVRFGHVGGNGGKSPEQRCEVNDGESLEQWRQWRRRQCEGHFGCWAQFSRRLRALYRWLEAEVAGDRGGAPMRESFEAYKERMKASSKKAMPMEMRPPFGRPTSEQRSAVQTVADGDQVTRRFGSSRTGLDGVTPTLVARFVASRVFVVWTSVMIFLNCAFIAIDLDYNDTDGLITEADPEFLVPEYTFCIFFLAEILLRMLCLQVRTDCLRDSWFVFDALLVVQMMGESMLLPALALVVPGVDEVAGGSIVAQLRLLRLLRIVRVMRAVPDLLNLIKALLETARSVTWTLVLLQITMFVFGIVFSNYSKGVAGLDSLTGSVTQSMWTLGYHGTLLDSPSWVVDSLTQNDAVLLAFLFPVFIFGANLCLMNVLIGIVVGVVSRRNWKHKENQQVRYLENHFMDVLWAYDKNDDKSIGPDEFFSLLTNPDVSGIFDRFGMSINRVLSLKRIIFAENKDLKFRELLNDIQRLRGNPAKVEDIVEAREHVRSCEKSLRAEISEVTRACAEGAAPGRPPRRGPTGGQAQQLLDRLGRIEDLCAPSGAEGELRERMTRLERAALRLQRAPRRPSAAAGRAAPPQDEFGSARLSWASARAHDGPADDGAPPGRLRGAGADFDADAPLSLASFGRAGSGDLEVASA